MTSLADAPAPTASPEHTAVSLPAGATRSIPILPFRLRGSAGELAALYYKPTGPANKLGDVLVVQSFGEELNRCRSMISMQARLLSELGIGTLILDPYGTGDSGGKHADCTWSQWRADLQLGIEWLRTHANGCRTLWGVRLGAILASELATADRGIERLLLWQPVLQGKSFYTQFLRIRVAAELEQADGVKSTEELRRWSREGQTLEVSGYHVGPTLGSELDDVKFAEPAQLQHCKLSWFEVTASKEAPVAQANRKALETYKTAGIEIDFEHVTGPLFWHLHERVVTPQLLQATTRRMSAAAPVGPPSTHRDPVVPVPSSAPGELAEDPVTFPCGRETLVGVLHRTARPARRGVVVVVAGGPQYRAGAHRQFVSLARELVEAGYPVLRFDLRGMGDSSGEHLGFQHSNADIRAAVDALIQQEPQLEEVVLFGECESASGILFYAFQDPRVSGAALINPWVRTDELRAKVIVKHYYAGRLLSREFWRKVFSGKLDVAESSREFVSVLRKYWTGVQTGGDTKIPATTYEDIEALSLPMKTVVGLKVFVARHSSSVSGRDYIAREFDEIVKESPLWQQTLQDSRIERFDVVEADHTFSREVWRAGSC